MRVSKQNGREPDSAAPRAAVALGNFDGVHLGHRAVLDAAADAARALGCETAAAVFEPHPHRYFKPDAPPFRLQTPRQRAASLRTFGAARVWEICFDAQLAEMSDERFARVVLVADLNATHVCVGADFRFGRGRMGDAKSLARLGGQMGFGVTVVEPVGRAGERYSSTAIRAALASGDLARAAMMLGRPWAIEGEVLRGFQRGRGFGFPTANIALGEYARPRLGVYAVRTQIDGAAFGGVASIGVNPTVGALPEPLLEAHLFGFNAELYGRTIEVELIAFLRDEAKFEDVEALKAQMTKDAAAAKRVLG